MQLTLQNVLIVVLPLLGLTLPGVHNIFRSQLCH